ncbi:MAG TPA: hypothetical protein VFW05_15450 [Verrucomicrobiae bacterium]|nr:hypothetical protein [Verrucomicrobiae bacterium]
MGLFSSDPVNVEVLGQALKCLVCAHDQFSRREAQLNTSGATFFNLDWLNRSGVCYVCARCGYIHWFLPT